MVENLPAMQKTPVGFLGWEDTLEEGMATYPSNLAWRILMDGGTCLGCSPWGHKELDMIERLTHTHIHTSGGTESCFARLTKSGVDIVSHSILVLFTRRERSQVSPLINVELKAISWNQHLKEDQNFL